MSSNDGPTSTSMPSQPQGQGASKIFVQEELSLQKMIESLYGLDRWELRRLAAEALLVSDGPDSDLRLRGEDPGTGVIVFWLPNCQAFLIKPMELDNESLRSNYQRLPC